MDLKSDVVHQKLCNANMSIKASKRCLKAPWRGNVPGVNKTSSNQKAAEESCVSGHRSTEWVKLNETDKKTHLKQPLFKILYSLTIMIVFLICPGNGTFSCDSSLLSQAIMGIGF